MNELHPGTDVIALHTGNRSAKVVEDRGEHWRVEYLDGTRGMILKTKVVAPCADRAALHSFIQALYDLSVDHGISSAALERGAYYHREQGHILIWGLMWDVHPRGGGVEAVYTDPYTDCTHRFYVEGGP